MTSRSQTSTNFDKSTSGTSNIIRFNSRSTRTDLGFSQSPTRTFPDRLDEYDNSQTSPSANVTLLSVEPQENPQAMSTSSVIDNLQTTIDRLKREHDIVKEEAQEYQKSNNVFKKKVENLSTQLATITHQNESLSGILKRKDRKIEELDTSASELNEKYSQQSTKEEDLGIKSTTLEKEIENVEKEKIRLKKAYETVIEGQKDMKTHFREECLQLSNKLVDLVEEQKVNLQLINKYNERIQEQEIKQKEILEENQRLRELNQQREESLISSIRKLQAENVRQKESANPIINQCSNLLEEIAATKNGFVTQGSWDTLHELQKLYSNN